MCVCAHVHALASVSLRRGQHQGLPLSGYLGCLSGKQEKEENFPVITPMKISLHRAAQARGLSFLPEHLHFIPSFLPATHLFPAWCNQAWLGDLLLHSHCDLSPQFQRLVLEPLSSRSLFPRLFGLWNSPPTFFKKKYLLTP